MTTAEATSTTYLCWTCAKDKRCTSDEHRYLLPHGHLQALTVTDLSRHEGHDVEES